MAPKSSCTRLYAADRTISLAIQGKPRSRNLQGPSYSNGLASYCRTPPDATLPAPPLDDVQNSCQGRSNSTDTGTMRKTPDRHPWRGQRPRGRGWPSKRVAWRCSRAHCQPRGRLSCPLGSMAFRVIGQSATRPGARTASHLLFDHPIHITCRAPLPPSKCQRQCQGTDAPPSARFGFFLLPRGGC